MQRQSLGSPGPKPLVSAVAGGAEREEKRKSIGSAVVGATDADKGIRASPRAERLIHLIPVLTILCLLVLYLFSHDLSLPDSQTLDGAEMRLDSKGTVPVDLTNASFFSFLVYLRDLFWTSLRGFSVGDSGAEKGGVALAIQQIGRGLKAAEERFRHRKLGKR
ncbi:hypothetical protein MUK42_19009 [Musa troglodytarum]|uniref:Transmembrane protein n=1 Tax=Musa troglodytarum TaxID=320322 RepID=A0A9E7EQC6_9LILI|nr:hypothetical protein MUK42_19009 [Musa troglodytarum]